MECFNMFVYVCVCADKAGPKRADNKKAAKKPAVAKPNTIKNLFMNSHVKRPVEVSLRYFRLFYYYLPPVLTVNITLSLAERCGPVQRRPAGRHLTGPAR